jgi:hypothetical protein
MQNVILSLRKNFNNLVLNWIYYIYMLVYNMQSYFFPTLNTSKSCFVNIKMVCMLILFMVKPAKPKR